MKPKAKNLMSLPEESADDPIQKTSISVGRQFWKRVKIAATQADKEISAFLVAVLSPYVDEQGSLAWLNSLAAEDIAVIAEAARRNPEFAESIVEFAKTSLATSKPPAVSGKKEPPDTSSNLLAKGRRRV